MAVKQNNQSVSKIAMTSAEQDAQRRAKKAKQKRSGGRVAQRDGFLAGLHHDKVRARTLAILGKLDKTLVSPAQSLEAIFTEVKLAYGSAFSAENQSTDWLRRHNTAKSAALVLVKSEPLRKFVNWTLNDAFYGTRC